VLRALTPLRLAVTGLALLALTVLILWQVHSDSYLLVPDPAHPVAPLVDVQGGHDPKGPGGIYFVDVLELRASILDELFPTVLHGDGASLVPADQVVPPGTTDKTARRIDLRMMQMSQKIAAAVALRSLGYKVIARPIGVLVDSILEGSGSVGKLEPTDVIVSLDGHPVRTFADLHRELGRHRIGEAVTVGIRRSDRLTAVHVKLTRRRAHSTFPALGIFQEQATDVRLPLRVRIDAGNVGGPSAGLPFALEVMQELGRDVARGYRVAATGQLQPDGRVIPIGGVKQKTYGARDAKMDVFLVPAGDNARDARRYAGPLRIIAVRNFQQALRALATLPRKRS
jgi:PDZ domain-containing protein